MDDLFSGVVKTIAARGLSNQSVSEKDYTGEDGILMCGVCNEPKRMYVEIPEPDPDTPNKKRRLLVAT